MAKITDLTWISNMGGGVLSAMLDGKPIQINARQKQPTLDAGCVNILWFHIDGWPDSGPNLPPVQIETEPGNIQTFRNHLRSPVLVDLLREMEGGQFEEGDLIASEVEIIL